MAFLTGLPKWRKSSGLSGQASEAPSRNHGRFVISLSSALSAVPQGNEAWQLFLFLVLRILIA